MLEHEAFAVLQRTMLPFFMSIHGLCVCCKCLILLGAGWSDIKKIAFLCVCHHSEFSERWQLSLHQHAMTHQKKLPTERSNSKRGLCSWKILPHQKIYQEHRGVFYKGTGSQDRNQDDTNEAMKGETKWKWNKVSTGWNITYSHYIFSS